mgnify:FL=1
MWKFALRKFLFMILTMVVMSILVFILVELMPGDTAQIILGMNATPEALEELREAMGLDEPLVKRYIHWAGGILRGDMGESLFLKGVSVSSLILRKVKHSLILAGTALIFFVPVSIGLGVLAGVNERKWPDSLISTFGLTTMSLPEFVSGVVLIIAFAVRLRWFPATSNIEIGETIWQNLNILILPALSITIVMVGYVSRMQRASMVTVMNSDYIRAARLKGLPRPYVIRHHAIRNALLPSITIIGMNMGWLVGGLVVVESLFAYPGIGLLFITAIKTRDVPLIEACMLTVTFIYVLSSFITDMLYALLNPRIRYK